LVNTQFARRKATVLFAGHSSKSGVLEHGCFPVIAQSSKGAHFSRFVGLVVNYIHLNNK